MNHARRCAARTVSWTDGTVREAQNPPQTKGGSPMFGIILASVTGLGWLVAFALPRTHGKRRNYRR